MNCLYFASPPISIERLHFAKLGTYQANQILPSSSCYPRSFFSKSCEFPFPESLAGVHRDSLANGFRFAPGLRARGH